MLSQFGVRRIFRGVEGSFHRGEIAADRIQMLGQLRLQRLQPASLAGQPGFGFGAVLPDR